MERMHAIPKPDWKFPPWQTNPFGTRRGPGAIDLGPLGRESLNSNYEYMSIGPPIKVTALFTVTETYEGGTDRYFPP